MCLYLTIASLRVVLLDLCANMAAYAIFQFSFLNIAAPHQETGVLKPSLHTWHLPTEEAPLDGDLTAFRHRSYLK